MFAQISDNRVFSGEDEEKFEKLISDMTEWMNKYAALYDDPEAIIDDLPEVQMEEENPMETLKVPVEVQEPESTPIVGSAEVEKEVQERHFYCIITYESRNALIGGSAYLSARNRIVEERRDNLVNLYLSIPLTVKFLIP